MKIIRKDEPIGLEYPWHCFGLYICDKCAEQAKPIEQIVANNIAAYLGRE